MLIALYIIIILVLTVLLIFLNFYLLAIYCHPDDKGWGSSLFCKILVIMGMTLTWAQVLLLPLDATNSRGSGMGLDMNFFWTFIYMLVLIFGTLLIPYAQYYYESDEELPMSKRCCAAIYHELAYIIVVSLLLFISYAFLQYADIPITVVNANISNLTSSSTTLSISPKTYQTTNSTSLELQVSFPVYAMAFMAFFGYFLFSLFGGVGLSALPIDLINEFRHRPKMISSSEGFRKKADLKKKTEALITQGDMLKEQQKEAKVQDGWWSRYSENRKVSAAYNKYKSAVLQLEMEYEIFQLELKYFETNPVIWYLKLILGIVFCVVSFLWWLQILLYIAIKTSNGTAASPFLNNILTGMENANVGFLGTGIYAFLALYLLWCTQKGNIKFGLRIPFIFSLHIMKENETWMNTFLFNVQLMLVTSVSVTLFCAKAFGEYLRYTTIDSIQSIKISAIFNLGKIFKILYLVLFKQCFRNIHLGVVGIDINIFIGQEREKAKNTTRNRGETKRGYESNKMNNNQTFKIILLGDQGVGKSTILQLSQHPTIGIETVTKHINNQQVLICDTAGQEKFKSLYSGYFRRANVGILVFDCSRPETLNSIEKWIEDLYFWAGSQITLALIANKTDLQPFEHHKQVDEIRNKYHIQHFIQMNKDQPELFEQLLINLVKPVVHQQVEYQAITQYEEENHIQPQQSIKLQEVEQLQVDPVDPHKCC